MPPFKVALPDGPLEIAHHDGGLIKEHTWHVKDGVVQVADDDIQFFTKHVTDAKAVAAGSSKSEDTPPASKKA